MTSSTSAGRAGPRRFRSRSGHVPPGSKQGACSPPRVTSDAGQWTRRPHRWRRELRHAQRRARAPRGRRSRGEWAPGREGGQGDPGSGHHRQQGSADRFGQTEAASGSRVLRGGVAGNRFLSPVPALLSPPLGSEPRLRLFHESSPGFLSSVWGPLIWFLASLQAPQF